MIASNVGGIPEIVRHGENGWLAENDAEPIAAAIRELLANRPLALQLAQRARQTVAEQFSLDRMIRDTVQLYGKVLTC